MNIQALDPRPGDLVLLDDHLLIFTGRGWDQEDDGWYSFIDQRGRVCHRRWWVWAQIVSRTCDAVG